MVLNSSERAYQCIAMPKVRKPVEPAKKPKTTEAITKLVATQMDTRISVSLAKTTRETPKLGEKPSRYGEIKELRLGITVTVRTVINHLEETTLGDKPSIALLA